MITLLAPYPNQGLFVMHGPESVLKAGYAIDHEENSIGISAVSVAIRSPSGELAATSIPAPTQRFDAAKGELIETLLAHAGQLQKKLNR